MSLRHLVFTGEGVSCRGAVMIIIVEVCGM